MTKFGKALAELRNCLTSIENGTKISIEECDDASHLLHEMADYVMELVQQDSQVDMAKTIYKLHDLIENIIDDLTDWDN